ncbi:hypothetical protein PLICRDRAFT_115337 [Plicaturopsis crispa FD-325 SS-3]|nr:hypothetical protein PLICRDRAFT_115337 [Plicaturopsis crispa FD-325 SS-3]
MARVVENVGSTARDFCMLERNLLSHLKLALLMSLLSSSFLLRASLSTGPSNDPEPPSRFATPMAVMQVVASICVIAVGMWEYQSGYHDLQQSRAFLKSTKPHLAVISVVTAVVFTTCIILLGDESNT